MLHLEDNAGVKAYYNGDKKFETLSDGAKVHGKFELDGDLKLLNDKKIKVGYDDDLQIYHDTSPNPDASMIHNTTATELFITNTDESVFIRANTGKDGVRCWDSSEDYKVGLFHDDTLKFETTSGGVECKEDLKLLNDKKIKIGYDDDLQIYHDTSPSPDASMIKNTTATQLFITNTNESIFIRANDSKDGVRCWPSSEDYKVGLFVNDTLALETFDPSGVSGGTWPNANSDNATETGVKIHGDLAITADLHLEDGEKIKLGKHEDLEIYHDGSDGYIKNTGDGNLFIAGHDDCHIYIRAKSGDNSIICYDDAGVALYEDNELRFETVDGGCKVTGDLEVTGTVEPNEIKLVNDKKIKIGYGDDLQIYHDTAPEIDASMIKNTTDTQVFIVNSGESIFIRADTGKEGIRLHANKDSDDYKVVLYHGGDTEAFRTVDGGCKVTGDLEVTGTVEPNEIKLVNDKKIKIGYGDDLQLYHETSGDDHSVIKNTEGQLKIVSTDGAVELYHDTAHTLSTATYGIRILGELRMHDDNKIRLGSDEDLEMYHDGSNGYLRNTGSGNFFITGDTDDSVDINIRPKQGANSIIAKAEAAVELYHNGGHRFSTATYGCRILGDLRMDDNEKVRLGTGQDFDIYFDGTDCRFHGTSGYFKFNRNLEPTNNREYDLGDGSNEWEDVYCVALDESSDRKWKKDIVTSDLGLSFINKLNPVSYKRTDGTSGRTHYGFIAQEVEQTLTDIGKTTKEFGGLTIDKENYFLRFSQFTAPLTKAVQELSAEVETLKAEIAALKSS
jgi:hypothetical protein